MRLASVLFVLLCACLLVTVPPPASATDTDGGNDCPRPITDYGDAPEGVIAYPGGVIGAFPSCLAPGPIASRSVMCGTAGTNPGPAGYVRHVQSGTSNYWLGCYSTAAGPSGIDSEPDAKIQLGPGPSACGGGPTDCLQPAFSAMQFGKDECPTDASDAGVVASGSFVTCSNSTVPFAVYNCGPQRLVYLNICVDMNQDGDWEDGFLCSKPVACASEWAVVNSPILLDPGCNSITSPGFRMGPFNGPGWMRITITDDAVPVDFPWNGSATATNGEFVGGETEDYPVVIDQAVASDHRTWGTLKTRYR